MWATVAGARGPSGRAAGVVISTDQLGALGAPGAVGPGRTPAHMIPAPFGDSNSTGHRLRRGWLDGKGWTSGRGRVYSFVSSGSHAAWGTGGLGKTGDHPDSWERPFGGERIYSVGLRREEPRLTERTRRLDLG